MAHFKIFLGGLNATGKTTLMNTLFLLHKDVDICHGSSVFFNFLGLKMGDYGSLERMDDTYKDFKLTEMMNLLFQQIDSVVDKRFWFFSGHYCRIKKDNTTPAVGEWIKEFDCLILMTANPDIITQRIKKEHQLNVRKRTLLMKEMSKASNPTEYIRNLLQKTKDEALIVSRQYNIPLVEVDSSGQSPEQMASMVFNFIKK